jgi:stage V sporulation protein SpoVS
MNDQVETKGNREEAVDETLLLVKGTQNDKRLDKEYVKKLSNAVLQVYRKHNQAKLRCVGAGSVNHAIKSWLNAKREVVKEEGKVNLILDGDYTTVNFDGVDKTGIILIVRAEDPEEASE